MNGSDMSREDVRKLVEQMAKADAQKIPIKAITALTNRNSHLLKRIDNQIQHGKFDEAKAAVDQVSLNHRKAGAQLEVLRLHIERVAQIQEEGKDDYAERAAEGR